jgi:uncharacterized repeat protein (TIGR03943 family)
MLVGAVVLRLTLTDTYRRYVQPGMGKWLLIAGVLVMAIGAFTLVQSLRNADLEEAHGHDHEDSHKVGVGWLLLAPIAALLLVAPPTLGAYGVDRAASVNITQGKSTFKRLPKNAAARPMTLLEYVQRGFDHNGASFNGAQIELTGFVAGTQQGGFRLARYQIACCAADATPVVVDIEGASGTAPAKDEWVTVTGTFRRGGGEIPRLFATTISDISAPEDPYE